MRSATTPITIALASSIALAACSSAPASSTVASASAAAASPAAADPASADPGPSPDYTSADNWLARPATIDRPVDVFFLYPTTFSRANTSAPVLATIDDAGMRQGAQRSLAGQASVFAQDANIFAPYYRQLDAVYSLTLQGEAHAQAVSGAPTQDATAAFTYYIEHLNGARPFILAGHSQGSDVMTHLLSGYLRDHPDIAKRMIVAYVIGYSVTPDYLAANPGLRFAERADDTGVLVSWNTESPVASAPNPVVLTGALAINPISWTRTTEAAPAAVSKGAYLADASGVYQRVPAFADATINTARWVVDASTPDVDTYSPGQQGGWPRGVYHVYDYAFYYFDLRANVAARIAAWKSLGR